MLLDHQRVVVVKGALRTVVPRLPRKLVRIVKR